MIGISSMGDSGPVKDRDCQTRVGNTKNDNHSANRKKRRYNQQLYKDREYWNKRYDWARGQADSDISSTDKCQLNISDPQIDTIPVTSQNPAHRESSLRNTLNGPGIGGGKNRHFCTERPIVLSKCKKKKNKLKTDKDTLTCSKIPSFNVNSSLSFNDQVEHIISQIKRPDEDEGRINEVLEDIRHLFCWVLPDVKPEVFGSTLTTLAFKTSDVDVFLFCPQGQPEYNFIRKKGSLMFKSKKFTNVAKLSRPRVPLIKACHVATGICVDISISTRLGVFNSMLLKFLITEGDDRIKKLLMIVLLWSKLSDLSGVNKMSSYTMYLLTIFYLQQLEPPILPPLHATVKPVDDLSWTVEIVEDPSKIQTTNKTPLKDLFRGFFEFYSKFDFAQNVISTFYGQSIPCSHFNDLDKLPDCFSHYKKVAEVCSEKFVIKSIMQVQGPIALNFNTAHSVSHSLLNIFILTCSFVVDFLDSFSEKNQLYLLLNKVSKPIYAKRFVMIKFSISNLEHEKFIYAFKATLENIFDIRLNEIGNEFAKQPMVAGPNHAVNLWFEGEGFVNPLSKNRKTRLNNYAKLNISDFAKEMLVSRDIVSTSKPNCNFQVFIHLKYYVDGCIDIVVADAYCKKPNYFKEISGSLKAYLEHYVFLALKENDLESVVASTKKLFPPTGLLNKLISLTEIQMGKSSDSNNSSNVTIESKNSTT